MSKLDPIKVAVADLKTSLTAEFARVDEDVKALQDAIAAGTVTDADVQDVVDSLSGAKAVVDAFDPIKPEAPAPEPVPAP